MGREGCYQPCKDQGTEHTQKEEQLGRPKAGQVAKAVWSRVPGRDEVRRARVQEAPDGACPVSQEQGSHGGPLARH